LEVIEKGQCTDRHPVPLLFVHGASHAAWCWEEHFLPYFADKGYLAVALSFRAHGRSSTSKPLRTCTIKDYADDVRTVANELATPPVLIGHSVGGFVVQKYLESSAAPAAVLLASFPPGGAAGFFSRQFRRHPWLVTRAIVTGKSLHCINTPKLARESFFCALTPEPAVRVDAAPAKRRHHAVMARDTADATLPTHDRRAHLLTVGWIGRGRRRAAHPNSRSRDRYKSPDEATPCCPHKVIVPRALGRNRPVIRLGGGLIHVQ
jgi:pimeloyl-ACP methyl ester carboxylesterase